MDGWTELNEDVDEYCWDEVYSDLEFRPTVDPAHMPSFAEPFDSMTWRIDTDDRQAAERAIRPAFATALTLAAGDDTRLYALDWQHTSYEVEIAALASGDWPIPAIPDGDYSLFFPRDFRFGWLGHPWEPSICAYGDLLPFVQPIFDELGWTVLRKGGRRRDHLRLV